MTNVTIDEYLALLDWRRRIFDLYRRVRGSAEPARAWDEWRRVRDEMFATHPQSPIPEDERPRFRGISYFPYDDSYRVSARMSEAEPVRYEIPTSGSETMTFDRAGHLEFELGGRGVTLEAYWLTSYGGGLFVPFRDATSGNATYGAGRYLLDTVKGADLGVLGEEIVLDLNFAYNPSCSYDPRWVCPLAPAPNHLEIAVEAGERL